jgi:catechol 2,3-dioxygenase-like lactoylglutathione lyase family enzyme
MIKLSVSALQRSVDFYRLLGFAPLSEPVERRDSSLGSLYGVGCDRLRMQIIQLADAAPPLRIELIEWSEQVAGAPDFTTPGAVAIGFDVRSLDESLEALARAGHSPVAVIREFPGARRTTRLANVADPDGRMIQLVETIRHAG